MGLIANRAATFSMTLKVGGVPLNIAPGDTVTATLRTQDGVTALSPDVPCLASALGANWPAGVVVIDFTDSQTAAIVAPACQVVIRVVAGSSERSWSAIVPVSTGEKSALFDRAMILAELRADRLMMLTENLAPTAELSDDYLWSKVRAAEADAQRQLKVFFQSTKIIPDDAPQAEIDALEAAGTAYAQVASRDYDTDFFSGDRWGDMYLDHKPLVSVEKMEIVYPFAGSQVYDIPADWIRMDRRAGLVRLIPVSSFVGGQLAALRISLLSAGRMMPFAVRARYTAGLRNVDRDYPDLLDCVKKMAVLRIIEDSFSPTSESISGDGLSQSFSNDVAKYQDFVDRMLFGPKGSNGGLYTAIHGVRMGVL